MSASIHTEIILPDAMGRRGERISGSGRSGEEQYAKVGSAGGKVCLVVIKSLMECVSGTGGVGAGGGGGW